ncbi:autotransporter outer membrane beta-barrel domain-containing protein [Dokdonella sp.]|uniref:autotransporter outer membrane beta-barrel domain-containing protein n=1 Tax=Dokdonella sp. TaxID=2291710 RepID=UPI003C67F44B
MSRIHDRRVISPGRARLGGILLALVVALPAQALAYQELVVVRKSGQSSSYVTQAKNIAAAGAACSDQSVAFAFTVEPRDGPTLELQRGEVSSADIVVDVTLTCSTLEGSAIVPFDAQGGTAVSGVDYLSTPGIALLNLSNAAGGSSAPVPATVRVELIGSGTTDSQTLNIVRTEGSFQGVFPGGAPIVGSIPGSSAAIVNITISGQVTIEDGENVLPRSDTAADQVAGPTTAFCSASGGGAGSSGCAATQTAADIVANPNLPIEVRTAAGVVLQNNLLAIAPDETTSIAFVAPLMASGQSNNLTERLAQLRGSDQGGTINASGLTFMNNGLPISVGSLNSLLNVDDGESARNEERRTLLGGTRLGLWLNGTLGSSETDRRSGNSAFDTDTWNMTGGVDYRFTDQFFGGVALGYTSLDGDYAFDQGSLDADATTFYLYSGYSLPNGLSFDGSFSYMRTDYQQKRVIELYELNAAGNGFQSLGRDIANGDQTVDQYGVNFGVTYTIMRGTWTFAPQAQISYLRTEYDAFQETGPSEFNLSYLSRSNSGQVFSIGGYFDKTFATSVGAFRPYLRAFYFADNSGSAKDLQSVFVTPGTDGNQVPLSLSMVEPDSRYGTAEVGLGFSRPIGTRTVDFNFGYMQTFSFQDLNRWQVRFDVRIPL